MTKERNWLIRTTTNKIIGPLSKSKVRELIENNTISLDDEICSANGYWFYIREKELVQKYIKGNATQSFNPVSEAKDKGSEEKKDIAVKDSSPKEVKDDLVIEQHPHAYATAEDKPENIEDLNSKKETQESSGDLKKKKKLKLSPPKLKSVSLKKDQTYLKLLALFIILLLAVLILNRHSFFLSTIDVIFPSSIAQEFNFDVKKKVF